MSSIFRKDALDRLTSPEQLDQHISIISRQGFLGLLAILFLIGAGGIWGVFGTATMTVNGRGLLTNDNGGIKVVAAEEAGIVVEILVHPGDQVQTGDVVLRLHQDDEIVDVLSFVDGELFELRVTEGQFVAIGTAVATVTSATDDFVVLAFLDAADGKRVTIGMPVSVVPSIVNQEEYGSMPGTVIDVSERPISFAEVNARLQDEQLAALLTQNEPPIMILVEVQEDGSTASGFRWHAGSGPPFSITAGTLASVAVTVQEQAPISLIFPSLSLTSNQQ